MARPRHQTRRPDRCACKHTGCAACQGGKTDIQKAGTARGKRMYRCTACGHRFVIGDERPAANKERSALRRGDSHGR